MIINEMFKLFQKSFFLYLTFFTYVYSAEDFDQWLKNFQTKAINSGISKKVVIDVMSNANYLPKVIEYDRFQPEFYEDTFTYIKKRSSTRKIKGKQSKEIENILGYLSKSEIIHKDDMVKL